MTRYNMVLSMLLILGTYMCICLLPWRQPTSSDQSLSLKELSALDSQAFLSPIPSTEINQSNIAAATALRLTIHQFVTKVET